MNLSTGLLLAALALCLSAAAQQSQVLLVADEFHAMQVLADQLEKDTGVTTRIIGQTELPANLGGYKAVLVYLHGELQSGPEHRFMQYAQDGGDLVVLHHSISSRKRENKDWFTFLKIELPNKPFAEGGYAYFAPVTFNLINVAPGDPLTTKAVAFDGKLRYTSQPGTAPREMPATTLADTEVYVNHVLTGGQTVLLGMSYTDAKTGKLYQQNTGAWTMPTGRGTVFYFMAGHRAEDFQNPVYRHMLDNAVEFHR